MSGQRAMNLRVFTCIAMAAALALTVSFAVAAATPAKAFAGGKTSVWVIDKAVTKYTGAKSTDTITYNKNGLVTCHKSVTKGEDNYNETYSDNYGYTSKSAFKKFIVKINGEKQGSFTFTLNSKGYVTKSVQKSTTTGNKYAYTYKYNKKGQVSSIKSKRETFTYKFNSKGLLSQITMKSNEGDKSVFGYKYDSKGNLTKGLYNKKTERTYKNTYKNGRLAKQVVKGTDGTVMYTCTYTYKKVKVPKSLVKMIKEQQGILANHQYAMYLTHK